MTEFTQLYLTPKIFLMGSSLAFSLKEDPVRCAKVCDKSWVILRFLYGQARVKAFCTLCTLHTVVQKSKYLIFKMCNVQSDSELETDSFLIKPLLFIHKNTYKWFCSLTLNLKQISYMAKPGSSILFFCTSCTKIHV